MGKKPSKSVERKYDEKTFEKQWDEYIDETTPLITIMGCQYLPSMVLRDIDPIAHRTGLLDYMDAIEKSGENPWVCPDCGMEYDNEKDAIKCCP